MPLEDGLTTTVDSSYSTYMENHNDFINYNDFEEAVDAAQVSLIRERLLDEPDIDFPDEPADDYFDEPDLDFGFEFDSAMASVGWGTDEDYGYYGDDGGEW